MDWVTEVVMIAVFYVFFSFAVSVTLGNRKRVNEIQREILKYNKELADALKNNDDRKIAELQSKQKEIMPLMMESMKYRFLPMLVIFPLLLGTVHVINALWDGKTVELPITIPILHPTTTYTPINLFWLVVIPLSLTLGLVYSLIERRHGSTDKNVSKGEDVGHDEKVNSKIRKKVYKR